MPRQRSIERDVDGFCGWDFLTKLVHVAPSPFMKGLIAALFETGGRISEVLSLRKRNVDLTLHPGVVVVKHMLLLKRFKQIGKVKKWKCAGHCRKRWKTKPSPLEFRIHNIKEYTGWITEPIRDHRTFPIRRDEPLTRYLVEWWKTVKKSNALLFPIERSAAFVRVRNVGKRLNVEDIPFSSIPSSQIYDHWFRAERACQLAFDYGFDDRDLDEFFGWKERKPRRMSRRYASLGWIALARKMGVKV